MAIKNEREYRNFELRTADENEAADQKKIVRGYASTFNEPYVLYSDPDYELREIVDSHAFDETDMEDVIMQYNHEGRVFARKSNGTLAVSPDEHGLAIAADLGGTDIGRQLYEEIAGGYTNKMSFGFKVDASQDKWVREAEGDKIIETRTINKVIKLYDVSAVSIPANDATSISVRTLVDGAIEQMRSERAEAEKRAREIEKLKLKIEIEKETSTWTSRK